ncbi:UDP-Glc:alpha-D-GlcNAc-diphosphoundecaprenol beta-1,3-glucosyltransferase WfgD [Meiothermus luteus]|jgi:glycosyltransferase involved in cell wall biosynthesis|uniref:UDP-Glc:alpha-D-GlcNAc-diphosphoundecaprenol beta-1,3-glucosyltransferase WfgD n=1 Tax=Meiothermus luteus TaxID=2026184 RepID=A0A399EU80_9DEIN|nr:glycosyltransferase [Meiothermus luteus]RIH87578.1 UDP-Glc:alpha-D-GlcNAc-diphosphoundecaprenol beta-1,3-glucosyltransferase WfgD [Meiothermus luteus]RMH58016.1 MAG: glycosyltransferase [Deinococcota bacterium]
MVSILVPTFNRPSLLLRALRSLQLQLYPDWEAIVVDDGDGAGLQAARGLGDPRVVAVPSQGRGQVAARNTGLGWAKGAYIALLDDDDWWQDPTHLYRVVRALRAQDGLVYRGGYLVYERDGLELERIPFDHRATPEALRKDNLLLASGVAYPCRLHDELGPFDPEMDDYWDWDWYLRVVGAGYPLLGLPGRGVVVSVHGANMSYAARKEERRRNLERLCAKHGLVGVELKDHRVIAGAV